MQRREFVKVCAVATALGGGASAVLAQQDLTPRLYRRARLLDAHGDPLKASGVALERALIFHYPYSTTPCFLLNLERAAQPAVLHTAEREAYRAPGGVGPRHSIVAYSAICAHQLTYPTRDISFIGYRAERGIANRHNHVIHCCSEHSEYDPAAGARVVGGPAPQPLAAILLEHDPRSDELDAIGTLGGEMFNAFFRKFEFRLALENGGAVRQATGTTATVTELENYCRQQVKC